jgi:maltose-binding protein MalE
MTICGPWFFPQLDAARINYGLVNIPKIDNAGWPASYSGAKVIMLNPALAKNRRRAAAVKKFVAYINTPANQLKYAKMVSEISTNKKAL